MSSHLESRDRPSPPHRRWNCNPHRCLSRKCSSSKLQLVPGQRESDLEVDQSWHLWDLMKYKGDTTLSFRLWVSKEQIPQMSFTEVHFQPTSCQYPSRKHTSTTSYHTKWVQVKNQFTHSPTSLTLNKIWNLEMRRMSMSKLQSLSSWRQRHHEQPLGIPGKAWAPSSPMEFQDRPMLVTEVFVFKASASAWPKGKRLGSRSRLTSVRPHKIQMRHNFQFPTFRLRVSKQQFPLDSGQMSLTQRCTSSQYHANIPVESIPHHTTQNEFKSKRNSPTSLTVNKIRNLEMRRMRMSRLQSLPRSWRQRHHEQPLGIPDTKGLHSLSADGIDRQVDACHGSVHLQSFS